MYIAIFQSLILADINDLLKKKFRSMYTLIEAGANVKRNFLAFPMASKYFENPLARPFSVVEVVGNIVYGFSLYTSMYVYLEH